MILSHGKECFLVIAENNYLLTLIKKRYAKWKNHQQIVDESSDVCYNKNVEARRLPQVDTNTLGKVFTPNYSELSVAADGSLFLFIGFNVYIYREYKS